MPHLRGKTTILLVCLLLGLGPASGLLGAAPLAVQADAPRAVPETREAGSVLETGYVHVEAGDNRILVALDRFERGEPADGRTEKVYSYEAAEPVEPLSFDGFGVLRVDAEGLMITLPERGMVFELVLAGTAPELPRPEAVAGHVVRHRNGQELATFEPSPGEQLTPQQALERVRRQRGASPVLDATLNQDPSHGGDDGTCLKSCSIALPGGQECSVTCPGGSCAVCTVDPLSCSCQTAL